MSDKLVSLTAGGLFGYGLSLSDMISPARVQWFFDILWDWDPTLIFVMIWALMVSIPGHYLLSRKSRPLLAEKWHFPWEKKGTIDKKLIYGSILFGIGWGLAGLCPGPAIASLIYGNMFSIVFIIAMLISIWATQKYLSH